jgi:chloramphenicol O-acetyltransferase type A
MQKIDMSSWSRRRHFALFNGFDNPHFGLCANVDITAAHAALKERGLPFTPVMIYLLSRTANAIPEFRHRIRRAGGEVEVVEHEQVDPSPTILPDDELFSFCTIPYDPGLDRFLTAAAACIADKLRQPSLEDVPDRDDLLYMTSIPWVSFTGLQHPMHLHPVDSIPRIAWGRYFHENGRLKMPLAVQGHHALMDGLHVGRYYTRAQELLDQPQAWWD